MGQNEGETGRGKYDRGRSCCSGQVKYPSDGQFSGRAREKQGKSRGGGVRKKEGCSARVSKRKRKRTVCSLDRIIAGGSGLTSSGITSTSPYLEPRTLPIARLVVVRLAVLRFYPVHSPPSPPRDAFSFSLCHCSLFSLIIDGIAIRRGRLSITCININN